MPSNVQPQPDPLRIAVRAILDTATRGARRHLRDVDTSGALALYGHATRITVGRADMAIHVAVRGPNCRMHLDTLDGPQVDAEEPLYVADPLPVGPSPADMLAAHAAVARRAYDEITATDVGTASLNELLYQRATLRGVLGALLDAVEGAQV